MQIINPTIQYHHYNKLIILIVILNILFINKIVNSQQTYSKVLQCLQFSKGICIRCPQNTHLNSGQCYENVFGCISYRYFTQLATCTKCNLTVSSPNGNFSCEKLNITNFQFNNNNVLLLNIQSYENTVDYFYESQQTFKQVQTKELANDTLFQKCNSFMRTGEYGHFISRTLDPVFSVFQYNYKQFKEYKILYQGSGGSMLMCLIGIQIDSGKIQLRSFVTIGRTQIVINCVDYSTRLECTRCRSGYHMDVNRFGEKICIRNTPGCIQYFGNICLKCREFQLLIENKCESSCSSLKDTRSLRFYGDSIILSQKTNTKTFQRNYFVNL